MSLLWVFYREHVQKIQLSELPPSQPITIGPDMKDTITFGTLPLRQNAATLYRKETDRYDVFLGNNCAGELTIGNEMPCRIEEETMRLLLTPDREESSPYFIGGKDEIVFSSETEEADIYKEPSSAQTGAFYLRKSAGCWSVVPDGQDVYVNGKLAEAPERLRTGDELLWNFLRVRLTEDDLLEVVHHEKLQTGLTKTVKPSTEMKKKYPQYRRTPRMVYDLPEDRVSFSFPSQESEQNNRGLWLVILPPLVMLIVMGVVAIIQPRGIFILVSLAMFMMTLITSTVQYFREKNQRKKREEKRERVYKQYLESKREELQTLSEKQLQVLTHHFPPFEKMKYLTSEISGRIWEKSLESRDFLMLRLGTGTVPASYEISMSGGDLANRDVDDLMEQSQHMQRVYKDIRHAPVTVDLQEGPMGLVGKPQIVKNEIHQLIGQLAFFNSYHDLRFVFIFHEDEYKEWEWMKWLPQFQLPHMYAKGFIYNEQTRDQLLSSIYELLRERDLEEDKEKKIFQPHFVFVITNQQLIAEHVILEYIEGRHEHLGISAIIAAETKESLAENIHTLVRYINEDEGDILIQQKKAVQIPFKLDRHERTNNERFSRTLRTLHHQVGMTNSIPETVSFLELFHAKEVKEIGIRQKWETSESAKSLAVPIGYKGKDDIVYLNLHEKAHGPHGLLAGTTGSGKSEFLQTYILSLAVHFHPHEAAFLLIDYKGGGMAQPFRKMPHLLGTITNIEGSRNFSIRALASIKSELKKRQRLFDQYRVNHINDYTKLYKQGETDIPMPHLFLISDEFAELKSEEPDFIRELVSAARIGRSLGVHLILATQKPGGIIDDQIWSNSRFKVALKVQDASDSKEILKNSDAANITVTGRGYLQVGNNEVYEQFQSAWSGAPYMEDVYGTEDDIAIVTDTGLIPLSEVDADDAAKKDAPAEIEAVVEEIERIQNEMGIEKLPSPWLPPLAERIPRTLYPAQEKDRFFIACVDEPDQQRQAPLAYTMMDDGNIGIFGSSGYGKSVAAITFLMNFAEGYTPEELHMYIFDFGNGTLLPLAKLPHTADYFLMDQMRKIEKFMIRIKEEIERRKRLFREKEVSHIKMYNSLSEEELPFIFITIDNFDIVKDEMHELETEFIQISRDGQSLGIYFLLTATRVNAVRQSLLNNIKTKVVHYLMDQSEGYSIYGRPPFSLEPIPGRVMIQKEELYFAQMFLPAEAENDLEMFQALKDDVKALAERHAGTAGPDPIPMLPDRLTAGEFSLRLGPHQEPFRIPVGLHEEKVSPVYFDLGKNKHCLILGQTQRGKTNILKVMLNHLLREGTERVGLFDSIDRGLSQYAQETKVSYLDTKEDVRQWIETAEAIFTEREAQYAQAVKNGDVHKLSFSPVVLMADGITRFQQTIDTAIQDKLAMFMKSYAHVGFSFIPAGNHSEFSKGYDSLTTEMKQIRHAMLLVKKSEQNVIPLPYQRQEPDIQPGFGYLVENGKEQKIQIPLCSAEREAVR
ncbi:MULTISPECIES: type VII secretion protein EssC [Bacillus amyloliquefaciens group]|uniref:type VII secretion protein EssC n=1 Tax=Bacillus amyloliquefaciens group TaxID=1938374 RepID=UPI000CF0B736|nr:MULTISPECIES: type VII secretion protein EssC [Bacillus amyloliquefaciens group]KAF1274612.1 type VII secretion protein EssC [Bacillus amyloliquefaciens]MCA1233444.1 type VII secretion protein EssC [Bacillus velezensis]MCA1311544.1 type VII secretion protein EssC [Bacillus velezensis]MCA1330706.1 type VII secretion protein EssC [Bacillus velezensis]MCM3276988.1 type VII secretion protein EssC [Bacillus velezensis]